MVNINTGLLGSNAMVEVPSTLWDIPGRSHRRQESGLALGSASASCPSVPDNERVVYDRDRLSNRTSRERVSNQNSQQIIRSFHNDVYESSITTNRSPWPVG